MCQCLVHCAPLVLLLTWNIRRLQPCPSKAVMWTPAFCLIYILRHSPSVPPLPAAPCQHHHPTTPTGFIKNAEFKLISDIWPFIKLFPLKLSFCHQGPLAHRRLECFLFQLGRNQWMRVMNSEIISCQHHSSNQLVRHATSGVRCIPVDPGCCCRLDSQ